MRPLPALGLVIVFCHVPADGAEALPLPRPADGWKVELVAQAPEILFPTAIVAGPDGTVYLGSDPMDMPGPPTEPIDSVVTLKTGAGKVAVFADKLWSVMGLEWIDGTLYVAHPPYLSAFRDTDGDGVADSRVDLITGLGPRLPGFSGVNDHVASGIRLGMDGFLYISVGDKGIPKGVARDGTMIQLHGGGVIRIRPDGTGLEVVSTGERNPLSVALTATDEIFTYGNDDDSKKWPNSLTHHVVGGHYGYPYQFLTSPWRALPIVAGQLGGSGTQGTCYNEDGLPAEYRGNLFFCDWGLSTVFRYEVEAKGGTFTLKSRTPFVTPGDLGDFRPFSMAVAADGASLWLVDWAYNSWLADGPKTGRLYRLSYEGADRVTPAPRPTGNDPVVRLAALDHPALSVRLESQRILARQGPAEVPALVARLRKTEPATGRLHAIWALDAIGTAEARQAIREALTDRDPQVRLQAARSLGIRRDRQALAPLTSLLHDPDATVRREAAIALGKLGDPAAGPPLMAALGDPDTFAAWSIRHAIRTLAAWDEDALVVAFVDPKRLEDVLKLTDEAWAVPVVKALARALVMTDSAATRSRIVANLAGLYRMYPEWSGHWFGTNPLAGQMPRKTREWNPEGMGAVRQGLALALFDRDPDVRMQAIAGLRTVGGKSAAGLLRDRLVKEDDARNLVLIAQALGELADVSSASALANLVQDAGRTEEVRAAALDALAMFVGPIALRARLAIVYDANAPAKVVARALLPLGRDGALPPNDLAGFLDHASSTVRAAALLAMNPKRPLPEEVKLAVIARLDDSSPEVRTAAIDAVARLGLRAAIPKLLAVANEESYRVEATLALAAMPDPLALPLYLSAFQDRSPTVRRAAEAALVAIRDTVSADLEKQARSGRLSEPAASAVERVLTRFTPVAAWKVIGPFARTTAHVFVGETSIDFDRKHAGAEGRTIAWVPRQGEPGTGRVVLDDFKGGAGDRGGFGYDTNGSPDLCSFGYAEIPSDRDRPALLLVGSSGTVTVTVNEKGVFRYHNFAGRPYAPDSDLVRVDLKKGTNRFLVVSRQGIGTWSFSVQVSEPSETLLAGRSEAVSLDRMREFALSHEGDPKKGEELFFDAKGIGCAKCHSANGRGTANAGPDLTGLALKYDKAEIIRSVLEPSSRIATGYQPVLLALTDGKVLTGLVRSETDSFIELVDAEAKVVRVPKAEIDERRVGGTSIMPAGQVDALSKVDFTDMISYLQSLKAAPPSR